MQSEFILHGYVSLVLLNKTEQKSATAGQGGNYFSNLAVTWRNQMGAIAHIQSYSGKNFKFTKVQKFNLWSL